MTRRKFGTSLVLCGLCVPGVSQSAADCLAQRKYQPTERQQETLKAFIQEYTESTGEQSYVVGFVDLRDDGVQEAIVYLTDPSFCGSGGCTTLILEPAGSSYKVVGRITITRPPIRALKTKTRGWHDISVLVAGGGIQLGYEAKLSFDGTTYPNNPTVPTAQPINQAVEGEIVIPVSVVRRPTQSARSPAVRVEVIIPGQAVGNLRVGMKISDPTSPLFPRQTKPLVGRTPDACNHTRVTWLDNGGLSPGVTAHFSDGRVFQIDVKSNRFQVQERGDVYGKSLTELTQVFPDGQLVRWSGSAWRTPSQKDELFWVVQSRGIAFEIDYGYERNSKSRSVKSVAVFSPEGKFEPEGCLTGGETLVHAEPSDYR